MIGLLEALTLKGDVKCVPLNTIRVKVHVPCQWTCVWCHMEGNYRSLPIKSDDSFTEALLKFRKRFRFEAVHFTGGEPSIYPAIIPLIRRAKDLGFSVKMTTNGQADYDQYSEFIDAGLSQLNVSVHTLDGETLGMLMNPPRSKSWGETAIKKQLSLIDRLKNIVPVKVNTVVGKDETPALSIANLIFNLGSVTWRAMNELGIGDVSYLTLKRLCDALEATPTHAEISSGSSSYSINFKTKSGDQFRVKLIRPFRLKSMCENCSVDATGDCQEYVYGPRIEGDINGLIVRNCLYRSGEPFAMNIDTFFNHGISNELALKVKKGLMR